MAYAQTLTYQFDIAPHLRRSLVFRARRKQRLNHLHRHDGRATAWRLMILGCAAFWTAVGYGIYVLT
jgi:hypothetical protein